MVLATNQYKSRIKKPLFLEVAFFFEGRSFAEVTIKNYIEKNYYDPYSLCNVGLSMPEIDSGTE